MSSVLFVNISDIHICEQNQKDIRVKIKSLAGYVEFIEKDNDFDEVCFLLAGDVTQIGTENEYLLFIDAISVLPERYKLISCAGNHDHNFKTYTGNMRNVLLRTSIQNVEEIDGEIIEACIAGQAEYSDFSDSICTSPILHKNELSIVYQPEFQPKIAIQSLNSAWCSSIKECSGELKFPLKKVIDPVLDSINIIMLHHPLSWFEANNQKQLRNKFRDNFNIIITGHEHLYDSFQVQTEQSTSLVIESIPLHDGNIEENGFSTFYIDQDDVIIDKIIWNGSKFIHDKQFKKSEILDNSLLSVSDVKLNREFHDFLNDIGTGFSHPEIDTLKLKDIFIYPNMHDNSDKKDSFKRIPSTKLIESITYKKVIVSGEESIGKTALLKKLYLDLIDAQKIPVFLDGLEIKKAKKFTFSKFDKAIERQYSDTNRIDLLQKAEEKTILIDNFDQIKGDEKSISEFLGMVTKHFDNVILMVSEGYELNLKGATTVGGEYKKCSLQRFGHRLRYELINKWNLIKEGCSECKRTLTLCNDNTVKTVNNIIGKNYIPSTPLFLLTMIQSMDNGDTSEINTSSYGYYYQYLITSSLGASAVKKENLDEIFNYIKELSVYFYKGNLKEDSEDNFWNFNRYFCDEYGLKVDAGARLDLLVKAKILKREISKDSYSFKYPYIYYFFIAKNLSENLSNIEVQSTIKDLISNLELRTNMDILMFLTHHSKDESIISGIVDRASLLFKEFNETKLDIDTQFIDDIAKSLPEISYTEEYKQTHENRLDRENTKDLNEESKALPSEYGIEDNEGENVDTDDIKEPSGRLISELNTTFKSLELLGQISRNYYGSLKLNQKKKLLEEAFSAPLRALGAFFDSLKEQSDETLEMISSNIKENTKDCMSPIEKDDEARKALFDLMTFISYSFIKKVSFSIGTPHLLPVIEELVKENPSNAKNLILLSTKLELGNHTTDNEFKKIVDQARGYGVSTTILKQLVVDYLYMFEVRESDVQTLCSIAGISHHPLSKKLALDKINKVNK